MTAPRTIFIRLPSNKTVSVQLQGSESVNELCRLIIDKNNMVGEALEKSLVLTHQGHVLTDTKHGDSDLTNQSSLSRVKAFDTI